MSKAKSFDIPKEQCMRHTSNKEHKGAAGIDEVSIKD